jgi:hypothetical protein
MENYNLEWESFLKASKFLQKQWNYSGVFFGIYWLIRHPIQSLRMIEFAMRTETGFWIDFKGENHIPETLLENDSGDMPISPVGME